MGGGLVAMAGSRYRVTSAAEISPATEYSPNWARPGKLEKVSAPKPHNEVATPSRIVGQKRVCQAAASRDCTR